MPSEHALAVPFPGLVETIGLPSDLPPHVTVLYPAPGDVVAIAQALAPFEQFDVRFPRFGRFPDGLWLAPEPAEPFVAMTKALMDAFPGYLPYHGAFPDIIPHLTVAQSHGEDAVALIEPLLPLQSRVERVVLYEHSHGDHWAEVQSFDL